jgi:uncharacterized protein
MPRTHDVATGRAKVTMKSLLTALIAVYQATLSRLLGPRCRFYPSCSQFAKECIDLYPLTVAVPRITRRLLCCHPLHPGGVDLP